MLQENFALYKKNQFKKKIHPHSCFHLTKKERIFYKPVLMFNWNIEYISLKTDSETQCLSEGSFEVKAGYTVVQSFNNIMKSSQSLDHLRTEKAFPSKLRIKVLCLHMFTDYSTRNEFNESHLFLQKSSEN